MRKHIWMCDHCGVSIEGPIELPCGWGYVGSKDLCSGCFNSFEDLQARHAEEIHLFINSGKP